MAFSGKMPGSETVMIRVVAILYYLFFINLILALFNCAPIPPLDGHWVLYGVLSDQAAAALERVGSFGFLII